MIETLDRERILEVPEGVESDSIEKLEFADEPVQQSKLLHAPIVRGFAFLAGGALTTLGVLGVMPWLNANDTLLGLFHVTPQLSLIHLVTGLAGLAIWRFGRGSLAFAYAIALTAVYVLIFSDGNIAFGNAVGMFETAGNPLQAHESVLFGLFPVRLLPQILANGFHVTLALVAFLVAAAHAFQDGARSTIRQRGPYIRVYRSRTRIRTAA
ncbi:MAG TPA: DUF4383 domain-containing protein [Ktedonobacterales bacterium]|nr:DUF4383 domain-containing protein [Ktedonobacterales bacterium]